MSRLGLTALILFASTTGAACNGGESSTLHYPATRQVDVVNDYHGTKVPEPYQWLENLDSPEVREWAAAQTALALPLLRENTVRPRLLSRVGELAEFWKEPSTQPEEPDLIDERSLAPGQSIVDVWPSHDRKLAVYAVSTGGRNG